MEKTDAGRIATSMIAIFPHIMAEMTCLVSPKTSASYRRHTQVVEIVAKSR